MPNVTSNINDITVKDAMDDPKGIYSSLIFNLFWPNNIESARTSKCGQNKYEADQMTLLKHYWSNSK
jgi:hypothetical protein